MPYAHNISSAYAIQKCVDIVCLVLERVSLNVGGLVGASVAEQVGCQHAVSPFGKVSELSSPVVGGGGEAVQEENRGLFRTASVIVYVAVSVARV